MYVLNVNQKVYKQRIVAGRGGTNQPCCSSEFYMLVASNISCNNIDKSRIVDTMGFTKVK